MIDIVPIEDVKKMPKLIEHHEKYKEIHGENKTVFMSHAKHVSLHQRLRREGKCNISSKELQKISTRSHNNKIRDFRKEIDKRVKKRVLGIEY